MMEDSSIEEAGSTPLATATSVLETIARIRRDPKLRHGLVSGAIGEVQGAFQPNRPKRKGKAALPSQKKSAKKRRVFFKHVIACLASPTATHNPTRQEWDNLHRAGLGKIWKGHTLVSVPSSLLAKEFHILIISLFPALISTPYTFCKLGGPYNNEIIVLGSDMSLDSLRSLIGNKAQLIIQPQENILEKATNLGGHKVCAACFNNRSF